MKSHPDKKGRYPLHDHLTESLEITSYDKGGFIMTRREWITAMGAAVVMPAAGATLPTHTVRPAHCTILDHKGEPVPPDALAKFYVCDLLPRPFPIDPKFAPGEVTFEPPGNPFRISVPLPVPGFGNVFLYADNRGAGYTRSSLAKSGGLLLNYEFAADRLATVRRLVDDCKKLRVVIPPATEGRITAAAGLLEKAGGARPDRAACARVAMESLRESLWAGEELVVERARQRIAKQPPRPGFLFGSNAFRFATDPDWYREYFTQLFNYATIPFYRGMLEKQKGQPDYSRPEAILKALDKTSIMVKGHPLIFLTPGSTPVWLKNLPFAETQSLCVSHVREAISRFRSHLHVWDVINEMHVQPDVVPDMAGFTRQQNVELTVSALKAAREADPTCYRVVNNTGTWGDYYMARKPAPWQQSVYDYLAMMKAAGADYEAIGLQYYHAGRDMLEFERNLEAFQAFGKTVHLTELGIASSSEEVGKSEWWGGGPGGGRRVWHGEQFTESSQADWFEQLYTIAYSKPWVQAITTWDFADPAFIPHGGLLTKDGTPKESYHRLAALLAEWRKRA
jgi:endo-1,4-beta-xylanase